MNFIESVLIFLIYLCSLCSAFGQRVSYNTQYSPYTIQDFWEANRSKGFTQEEVWRFRCNRNKCSKDSSIYQQVIYDTSGLIISHINYAYRKNGWCRYDYEIADERIITKTKTCSFWDDYSPSWSYSYYPNEKLEFIVANSKHRQNDTIAQYTYNDAGNLLSNIRDHGIFTYDEQGNFVEYQEYSCEIPSHILEYDQFGNLKKESFGACHVSTYSTVIEYDYNATNERVSSTIYDLDEITMELKKGEECTYEYENGKLTKRTCINTEDLKDAITVFDYDENGLLKSTVEQNVKGKPKRMYKYYRK